MRGTGDHLWWVWGGMCGWEWVVVCVVGAGCDCWGLRRWGCAACGMYVVGLCCEVDVYFGGGVFDGLPRC